MKRHPTFTDTDLVNLSLQTGKPVHELLTRATGRTIACALQAIASAMKRPRVVIVCNDHTGMTCMQEEVRRQAMKITNKLNLDGFDYTNNTITYRYG